jgi:hypothetical protein
LLVPQAADRVAAARNGFAAGAIRSPLTTQFLYDGRLRITQSTAGTLEVGFGQQVLLERSRVTPETVTDIAIPNGALLVEVRFTPDGQDLIVINVPVRR